MNLQIKVKDICSKIQGRSELIVSTLDTDTKDSNKIIEQEIAKCALNEKTRLSDEFFGMGPLKKIIEDDSVNEIIINDYNHIWIEKHGKIQMHNDSFLSELTYLHFISRLCKDFKIILTQDTPFGCASNEHFRIHLTSPTVTTKQHSLCIRKHKKDSWTLGALLDNNTITENQKKIIDGLIHNKKNFLVIGATGSGKTSFLNACLKYINPNERVLILEDSNELIVPNSTSNKFLTRFDSNQILQNIDLSRLVKESLRARPDRLVLGEVRGPEAKDLLMALATGHHGSWGTIHAQSAHEALLRLEMLVQLGAPEWSLDAIRKLLFLSIQNLICIEKKPSGQRVVKDIFKICGQENFGLLLEKVD